MNLDILESIAFRAIQTLNVELKESIVLVLRHLIRKDEIKVI
jgi:hypothetical protein